MITNSLEYNNDLWYWLNKTKACSQITSLNDAFDRIIEQNIKENDKQQSIRNFHL